MTKFFEINYQYTKYRLLMVPRSVPARSFVLTHCTKLCLFFSASASAFASASASASVSASVSAFDSALHLFCRSLFVPGFNTSNTVTIWYNRIWDFLREYILCIYLYNIYLWGFIYCIYFYLLMRVYLLYLLMRVYLLYIVLINFLRN